ncbi:ABC transporter ATP-binding protein [Orbaceae bacterium ESL0721]|nr:ABC transporter ATP-binding protein [Orbaceae bacterium ESL0721]
MNLLAIEQLTLTRQTDESKFTITLPKLTLSEGEIVVLQGDSGCGKSTLLEMIGLILKPDQVTRYALSLGESPDATSNLQGEKQPQFNIGELISQNSTNLLATIRANYFGFMLQTGGLLPFLTIKENILLPLKLLQKSVDQRRIDDLVTQLKIGKLLSKYPKQLSIGERQRASFVRSIIHQPALLLADEPTSALDPYNANLLFDLIIEQAQRDNIAAIIVTHDIGLVTKKGLSVLEADLPNPHLAQFVPKQATTGDLHG